MRYFIKALIVIATLTVAAGFYLTVDHFYLSKKDNDTQVSEPEPPKPAKKRPPRAKKEPPRVYEDSPRKQFCEEFVSKAAPDILLKGPKAILERNVDKERCKALLPTLSPLTQAQLDEVRQDIMRVCMEEESEKKIEQMREMLKKMPSDCADE